MPSDERYLISNRHKAKGALRLVYQMWNYPLKLYRHEVCFPKGAMTFFLVWGNGQHKGLEAQHFPSQCYVSLPLNFVNLRPIRNSRSLDEQLITGRALMRNSFYLRPCYFNDVGRRWKLLLYGWYKKCLITKCTRALRALQCLTSAPLG